MSEDFSASVPSAFPQLEEELFRSEEYGDILLNLLDNSTANIDFGERTSSSKVEYENSEVCREATTGMKETLRSNAKGRRRVFFKLFSFV